MQITETITTTITTTVDLQTMTPSHDVKVDAEVEVLPHDAVYAAIEGGLRSALTAIELQRAGESR